MRRCASSISSRAACIQRRRSWPWRAAARGAVRYNPAVPEVLAMRGRSALSSFRVAKLLAALAALRPQHAISNLAARYWHFVELGRALAARERDTLERL